MAEEVSTLDLQKVVHSSKDVFRTVRMATTELRLHLRKEFRTGEQDEFKPLFTEDCTKAGVHFFRQLKLSIFQFPKTEIPKC